MSNMYPIGSVFRDKEFDGEFYILAQIFPFKAYLVGLNGNRFDDRPIEMSFGIDDYDLYNYRDRFEFVGMAKELFNTQKATNTTEISEAITPKESTIEFFRYIRPLVHRVDSSSEFVREEIDNLQGVTIHFKLDYERATMTAGIAICNGDNFDKKIGMKLAKNDTAQRFVFEFEDANDLRKMLTLHQGAVHLLIFLLEEKNHLAEWATENTLQRILVTKRLISAYNLSTFGYPGMITF